MKGIAAATAGVFCLSPLLLAGTAVMAAAGSGAAAQHPCASGTDIDTAAVSRQVAALLHGKGAEKNVHVEGLDLPNEQIPNAKTIIATGISLHAPARGQVVALATALQESRLRNLGGGDRDSLGLFQQRPSQGWGTAQQIRDPVYASTRFYKALFDVHGWQQMTVTQAAQAVQKSGLPGAYAPWEKLARALQQALAKTLPNGGAGSKPDKPPGGVSSASGAGCAPGEDRSAFGPIPEGAVPAGYRVPAGVPAKVRTALEWAMHQLGTPYQWGGTCTNSHGPDPMGRCDCSSLMQQAYAAAGIKLSRVTYTQVGEGTAVSSQALKPGDLLFARGSASRPEHVGMYMGAGLVINAPRTGKPVRIEPVNNWQILAARRVVT